MRRIFPWALVALLLQACALDGEADLRAATADWLALGETRYFVSQSTCTVAVFSLRAMHPKSRVARATTLDEGLRLLRQGRVTWLDLSGHSPNAVSELVMSSDLGRGLGLVSNTVGPAQRCMDDALGRHFYRIVTSLDAFMIYAPAENAVILMSPADRAAMFLRGNV